MQKTIETSVGPMTVTALKRRQVKQLKADNHNLREISPENAEATVDAVLVQALTPADYDRLDDLYEYEIGELFKEAMGLTFLGEEPGKNSG